MSVRFVSSGDRTMSDGVVRLDHQLLTAREVAELLRLPVSTVYELARTGRLPYLRIGRAMRFSRQDLEVHLAQACRANADVRRSDVGRTRHHGDVRRGSRRGCEVIDRLIGTRKWYPRPVATRFSPAQESENPPIWRAFTTSG